MVVLECGEHMDINIFFTLMGIKDLSKQLRESNKPISYLSALKSNILGVDTSIWLNKAIFSSTELGHIFHQEPRVSVCHL